MLVRDLIAHLQTLPQDIPAVVDSPDLGVTRVKLQGTVVVDCATDPHCRMWEGKHFYEGKAVLISFSHTQFVEETNHE